jgi:zinc transport system substrate-binding protein
MKNFAILIIFLIFNIKNSLANENKPLVVASIKPVYAIVKALAGNSVNVELLLKNNISPHDFHLKPSHVKTLQKANIIFYIDDNFENSLINALNNLPKNIQKYPLSKSGVNLIKSRPGGLWQKNKTINSFDLHFWLDIKNAKIIAKYIAEKLSDLSPQNKELYAKNLAHFLIQLDELDKNIATSLIGLENRPFLVFHDAYQYFERSYNLSAIGSITFDPTELSLASRIRELKEKIKNEKIFCVFYEPQFSDKLSKTIVENSDVKMGIIDPLGGDLKEDENLYLQLMNNLANSFKNCLKA